MFDDFDIEPQVEELIEEGWYADLVEELIGEEWYADLGDE